MARCTTRFTMKKVRRCQPPIDFSRGSKSMLQLVADSGVEEFPATLTAADIVGYLAGHPDVVEYWLQYSANKRVTSGWYFARRVDRFEVGYHPKGKVLTFSDPCRGCAEFLIREISALKVVRRG